VKKPARWTLAGLALVVIGGGVAAVAVLVSHGVSARDEPTSMEAWIAGALRRLAIPHRDRDAKNPIALTAGVLDEAREHFADHCAICHANDGSGKTEIGRNLYPKAPDMRLPHTQSLSDGELFWIIENGVRLTGMPAWGTGERSGQSESWKLVHFIRHLPAMKPDEVEKMKAMNPVSPKELAERKEAEEFLSGEDEKSAGDEKKPPPARVPHVH